MLRVVSGMGAPPSVSWGGGLGASCEEGSRMSGSGPVYLQWGALSITAANLAVLALMILTFIVAVGLRLPEHRPPRSPAPSGPARGTGGTEGHE